MAFDYNTWGSSWAKSWGGSWGKLATVGGGPSSKKRSSTKVKRPEPDVKRLNSLWDNRVFRDRYEALELEKDRLDQKALREEQLKVLAEAMEAQLDLERSDLELIRFEIEQLIKLKIQKKKNEDEILELLVVLKLVRNRLALTII